MELRQLVYLDAVARCGGFTRAAESLHVAQPAVSAQIRKLERELGVDLFVRGTRRVSLTHAGELALVRARSVLAELDALRADVGEVGDVLRGEVRLGATLLLGAVDLPAALVGFRHRHPGVTLRLRSGLMAQLREELDAGDLDLVLAPLDAATTEGRRTTPLAEESVVLVTEPGRHGLALIDVRDQPFVCLPADSGLRGILDAAARATGFVPRVELETRSAASVRQLVSAGLGVALLAASSAREPGPPVAVHELSPAPAHPPIGIVEPRGRRSTPAARALREELLAHRS